MFKINSLSFKPYKINLEKINEEIEKAVKFAEESPFPDPEETLEDVYA